MAIIGTHDAFVSIAGLFAVADTVVMPWSSPELKNFPDLVSIGSVRIRMSSNLGF
jgi:hypothetical protein